MKALKLFVLIAIFSTTGLLAQDWATVNPKMNNILVDTTLVRATIAIIEPGDISDAHTHPAAFVYALTDGKLKVHYTDGQTEIFELKAGDNMYADPEKPHRTENIGTNTVKFLLVELKEHPYVNTGSK